MRSHQLVAVLTFPSMTTGGTVPGLCSGSEQLGVFSVCVQGPRRL